MSDLVHDRYRLTATPGPHVGLVRAHDELLEQDVDLVLLEPVEPVERLRMLRTLRLSLRATDTHVAQVQDTGTAGERPFLVLSGDTSPEARWTGAFTSATAARLVLDVLDGVESLRAVGLRWFSLRRQDLRVDEEGRAQVVPLPVAAGGVEEQEMLVSLGLLLGDLVPEPTEPLRTLAARATGLAAPPLRDVAEFRGLLQAHAAPRVAPGSASQPASAVEAVAEPLPTTAATPVPAPAAPATPEATPQPVAVERARQPVVLTPEPLAVAPTVRSVDEPPMVPIVVPLSSLLAQQAPDDDYVPLSSLMHDEDTDEIPPRSPRGRGLFHRRSRESTGADSSSV